MELPPSRAVPGPLYRLAQKMCPPVADALQAKTTTRHRAMSADHPIRRQVPPTEFPPLSESPLSQTAPTGSSPLPARPTLSLALLDGSRFRDRADRPSG